jgi:hypothetical protein
MTQPIRLQETSMPETGFSPPRDRELGNERRTVIVAELIATVALAMSTLAVAAVLSIGVAHAGIW